MMERSERATPRVLSIDVLRGLDVLLMLFVNEVAGVRGAPAFLLHTPHDADGMTITDVVFPAFLFIVGHGAYRSPSADACAGKKTVPPSGATCSPGAWAWW